MVEVWIYILKEEPTVFADRVDAACERNGEVEDGSLIFWPEQLKNGVLI